MPEFELPREYIPQSLRLTKEKQKPEKTTYAIGYTTDVKHFGMAHGPTESLQDMLDTIPEDTGKIAVLLAYPGRDDDWEAGIL